MTRVPPAIRHPVHGWRSRIGIGGGFELERLVGLNRNGRRLCTGIRSESERAFWSNDQGWVYDVASATPYGPEHVCRALVVQWRRDGHPIMSPRGHWMWIAQRGGLSGYKGADYDGPYESEAQARAQAIAALGTDKPLMTQRDAEYVLADEVQDYPLD